ncbi:MAG: YajQ family cyclic di-GMP-binding protein [Anaerolineae bacterium]|nr:YajQ family cyclic di-GMP-binding protein [Anaerolineae bacterium]MCI0706574.1 YajQ family cyclic di-GMP-binding protein [Ignavibacteriota bacterium]
MAQPSFDIVSEVNLQEVDNAINQSLKEIIQRYDFKDSNTSIDFDKKEKKLTVSTSDDFHLKSAVDILNTKLIKRGVSVKSLTFSPVEQATSGTVRQTINLKVGIDKENAKTVVKMIKDANLKVQSQIMDDQIRVTGKNKDDLQAVITKLRNAELPIPLQFINYR